VETQAITFTLDIDPQGEARGRATAIGGHARIYTPAKTRAYRAYVAALAEPYRPAERLSGALSVEIVAMFKRPAYMRRRSKRTGELLGGWPEHPFPKTSKPDIDNVEKAILDALKMWWGDDAQVSDQRTRKRWASADGCGSVQVTIRPDCEDTQNR
jgi:Holliday junction resolvase RusA-like endonuclease